MEEKQYDLFMEIANNPELNLLDFKALGLNANNTQLLNEDVYLNSSKVQEKFKDLNGNFDKDAAHKAYQNVQRAYNIFSSDQYTDNLINYTNYDANNMFTLNAPNIYDNTPLLVTMHNPLRLSRGLVGVGMLGPQFKTEDEIALSSKVLVNPKAATRPDGTIDESIAVWHDAPEESFFQDFWDTRVMAQWDEDGTHLNPETGQVEKHLKGELKYNKEGVPYYENLDGRDVYGRRVLNKMNTITKEDSRWNKYDFFDSDDLNQKALGGVVMRNLALVGSMFLPWGIGTTIAAVSAGTQVAGMLGTLGKMLTGSDSPNLSAIEGWAQSWNRLYGKTQYAQTHTWCPENFIDTFADLVALLKELRAIFELVPGVFNGGKFIKGEESIAKIEKDLFAKNSDILKSPGHKIMQLATRDASLAYETAIGDVALKQLAGRNAFIKRITDEWMPYSKLITARQVETLMSDYNKIGGALGKAYMAGLISLLLYGEAKMNGLSDQEATLVTAGRFLAETALLNTPIGDFIFPELRFDNIKYKKIMQAFYNEVKESRGKINASTLDQAGKSNWALNLFKKAFNWGFDAQAEALTMGGNMLKTAFTMGTEAGIVNDIEEGLNDLAKAAYNTVDWFRSDRQDRYVDHAFGEKAKWKNFENAFDRYAMGMASGLVGGGITSAAGQFKQFRSLEESMRNLKPEAARLQLVFMHRNGEIGKFLKLVDRANFGDKNLSGIPVFDYENLDILFNTTTDPTMNQDAIVKRLIHMEADAIGLLIDGNGANLSDLQYLDIQTLKDLRLQILQQSPIANRWLLEYNSILSKMAALQQQIRNNSNSDVVDSHSDEAAKDAKVQLKALATLKLIDTYEQYKQQLLDLVSGKMSGHFIAQAMFDMNGAVNSLIAPDIKTLPGYVMAFTGKDIKDITEEDLNEYTKRWNEFKGTLARDQVIYLADAFHGLSSLLSDTIIQYDLDYLQMSKNSAYVLTINRLNAIMQGLRGLSDATMSNQTRQLMIEEFPQALLAEGVREALTPEQNAQFLEVIERTQSQDPLIRKDAEKELGNLYLDQLLHNTKALIEPILKTPFLNSAVRASVLQTIDQIDKTFWYEATHMPNVINNSEVLERVNEKINDALSDPEDIRGFDALFTTLGLLKNKMGGWDLPLLYEGQLPSESIPSGELMNQYMIYASSLQNELLEAKEKYGETGEMIKELKDTINSKSNTPIEQFARKFAVSATGDTTIGQLFDQLDALWQSNLTNIEELTLPEELKEVFIKGDPISMIDEAKRILGVMRASIIAARTDNNTMIDPFGGYNRALNAFNKNTENWKPLAEISGETASAMEVDINTLYNKLNFFEKLFKANESLKLQLHNKVLSISNYISYNRLAQLFTLDRIAKFGIGADKVKAALDQASLHAKYAPIGVTGRLGLNKDDREKLEEEHLKITDALYEWANSPEMKKNLLNPLWISENLLKGNFTWWNNAHDVLDLNTKAMDDASFLHWLFAHMSMNERAYNYNMIEPYTNGNKAPISTQEGTVFINIAAATNLPLFKNLKLAITKTVIDTWSSLTKEERAKAIDAVPNSENNALYFEDNFAPYILSLVPALLWYNVTLSEGGAGVGKTEAVAYFTRESLAKLAPDMLKNVYYAHVTKDSADAFAESQSPQEGTYKTGNHEDLMKLLFTNMTFKTGMDGKLVVSDAQWKLDSNGRVIANPVYNPQLKPEDIPTAIFLDEVGHVNLLQLDALSLAAEKYGFHIFASGDFKLSGVDGSFTPGKFGNGAGEVSLGTKKFNLLIHPDQFIHGMKLGVSMRTANSAKNTTLTAFATNFLSNKPLPLKLAYYEDAETLKGDKLYDVKQEATGTAYNDAILLNIITDIKKMIKLTKELEAQETDPKRKKKYSKVGYIYYSNNSELYKAIKKDPELDENIDMYQGSAAQGKEAGYFIVEAKNDSELFDKDLYTGVTRSSEGSIIIALSDRSNYATVTGRNHSSNISRLESVKLDNVKADTYGEEALRVFKTNRIDVLKRLTKGLTPETAKIEVIYPAKSLQSAGKTSPALLALTLTISNGGNVLSSYNYEEIALTDPNQSPEPHYNKAIRYNFASEPKLGNDWLQAYLPSKVGLDIVLHSILQGINDDGTFGKLWINDIPEALESDDINKVTQGAVKPSTLRQQSNVEFNSQLFNQENSIFDVKNQEDDDTNGTDTPFVETGVTSSNFEAELRLVALSNLSTNMETLVGINKATGAATMAHVLYTSHVFSLGGATYDSASSRWIFPHSTNGNTSIIDRSEVRIDGVNGLRKMYQLAKDGKISLRSDRMAWYDNQSGNGLKLAEKDLAYVWQWAYLGRSKEDINAALAEYFDLDPSKTYITFAIKSTANLSTLQRNQLNALPYELRNSSELNYTLNNDQAVLHSTGEVGGISKLDQGYTETTLHNPSGDIAIREEVAKVSPEQREETERQINFELNRAPKRRLVMIYGTELNDGTLTDLLEVNIGQLESPLTVIQKEDGNGNLLFPELLQAFLQGAGAKQGAVLTGEQIYNGLSNILSLYGDKQKFPQFARIADSIKLWIDTTNDIWFMHNDAWVPSMGSFSGAAFTSLRGTHQLDGHLLYSREEITALTNNINNWLDLQFLADDFRYATENGGFTIYGHSTGLLGDGSTTISGKNLAQLASEDVDNYFTDKGHPYILLHHMTPKLMKLWSHVDGLADTSSAWDYYVRQLTGQLDPKAPKVTLAWILPPGETVSTYLENVHSLITSDGKGLSNLGNNFTAYRIWQRLLSQGSPFRDAIFNPAAQYRAEVSPSLITKIEQTIATLEALEKDFNKAKTYQEKLLAWNKFYNKLTKPDGAEDWSYERGLPDNSGKKTILQNLVGSLHLLVFPNWVRAFDNSPYKENYKNFWKGVILESVGDYLIRYRLTKEKGKARVENMILNGGRMYVKGYNGGNLPIQIFGKFDTSMLQIDLSDWISDIVDQIDRRPLKGSIDHIVVGKDEQQYVYYALAMSDDAILYTQEGNSKLKKQTVVLQVQQASEAAKPLEGKVSALTYEAVKNAINENPDGNILNMITSINNSLDEIIAFKHTDDSIVFVTKEQLSRFGQNWTYVTDPVSGSLIIANDLGAWNGHLNPNDLTCLTFTLSPIDGLQVLNLFEDPTLSGINYDLQAVNLLSVINYDRKFKASLPSELKKAIDAIKTNPSDYANQMLSIQNAINTRLGAKDVLDKLVKVKTAIDLLPDAKPEKVAMQKSVSLLELMLKNKLLMDKMAECAPNISIKLL